MRSKTTPIWEQHIEKGVLGLMLILLLVILFLGLTGAPNQVDVRVSGQSQSLSPGELNDVILAEASKIRAKQTPDAAPMGEPPSLDEIRMVMPEVGKVINAPVLAESSFERSYPVMASSLVSSGTTADLLYNIPTLPSIQMLGAEQFLDEFTEAALEQNPELEGYTNGSSREID